MDIPAIVSSTLLLLAIIDPFITLAALMTIYHEKGLHIPKTVTQACLIAGILMLVFLFLGESILTFFRISLDAFKIGGAIVLLLLGVQTVLGIEWGTHHQRSAIAVVIATPLITGPGVATTLIILRHDYGLIVPLIAAAIALAITWAFLMIGNKIHKKLGDQFILVFSRIVGLFLVSYAMQIGFEGIKGIMS